MCSPPKKSLPIKITNKKHTDNIPICTVEKLVDVRRPEHIDNKIRRMLIFDAEKNKGNRTSVCAIYRFGDSHMCLPESSPNSEQSLHASYMAVDDIERSKTLGPGDLTVVLDMIGEGENINSHRFSPEPTITDQHKRSRTIHRMSPVENMILEGFKNFQIKSRFPVMCSPPKRSLLIKVTNKRHTDTIPVHKVEKLVDMRRP